MTTERDRTSSFAELIDEIMEHGDKASVGRILGVPRQHIAEMAADVRRSPFEGVALWIEQLRRNNNSRADELFIALARRLGFVVYREADCSVDDIQFGNVLNEFSDLVKARADAERDGTITPTERRDIAKQASDLIERLASYRDAQQQRAKDDDARKAIRRVR